MAGTKEKTYTGASDVAKLTRYLTTHAKTKNNTPSGLKYSFVTTSEYLNGDVLIYSFKTNHNIYVNNNEQFVRSLKIIGRLGKKGTFTELSDTKFEHIQSLNTGMVVKETTEIIGIS